MSITLTEAAAARIASYLERQPGRLGLRFGVRRTGCSGWAYAVDLADSQREDDHVFEDRGIRIFVDAGSLRFVDGTRIDFVREGLGSHFVFDNPNVAASCGCGESFTTDGERVAGLA
jgi:iron-sulfur cluster assembly protein